MGSNDYAGLLYAQPSFQAGVARTLDVGGTFDDYNYSRTSSEADDAAVASDWYSVAVALMQAIRRFSASKARQTQDAERSV